MRSCSMILLGRVPRRVPECRTNLGPIALMQRAMESWRRSPVYKIPSRTDPADGSDTQRPVIYFFGGEAWMPSPTTLNSLIPLQSNYMQVTHVDR